MPIARTDNGLVLFAHVPRCGGSAVENHMHGRFGTLAFLDRGHGKRPADRRWSRTSPQHVDRHALDRLMPPAFFAARFAVVRHPVSRLRSVFLYHRDVTGLIPSDAEFSTWLSDIPRRRAGDAGYLDNHARPMVEMVPGGCEIFRLEDGLDKVAAWLDGVSGQSWPKPIGRVHGHAQLARRRGAGPGPPVQPVQADLELIADRHPRDFERFGYECRLPEQEPAP